MKLDKTKAAAIIMMTIKIFQINSALYLFTCSLNNPKVNYKVSTSKGNKINTYRQTKKKRVLYHLNDD
jgi:hypothetical protein